jgi:signal transduction histidine kinase
MKLAPHRLAVACVALATIAVSGAATLGDWQLAQPMALIAGLALMLAAWGWSSMWAHRLRLHGELADSQAQLARERHAHALAERARADTHTALCRVITQQEQVRESERKRIARDIHDDLGQHLLALKIDLSLMHLSTNGAHPLIHQKIGSLLGQLDLTTLSLRRIINDLYPLALEHGLQTAMEAHLSEFSRSNGIRHELEADPGAFQRNQDRGVDSMLFRILQESLANVVRHARASEVKIALLRSGDQLTLKVRDNGIGMADLAATRGCGLLGIADRVTAAGGRFVIDSQPGSGTLLSLSIPLAPIAAL